MQQSVDPSTRQTPLQIQPSIPEEHELVMSGSEESDELSTAQPNNLFNKPPHDSTNQESNNQSDEDSFHSASHVLAMPQLMPLAGNMGQW